MQVDQEAPAIHNDHSNSQNVSDIDMQPNNGSRERDDSSNEFDNDEGEFSSNNGDF